jgi:GR25 family glycosyltransferase involved in LPS biosynthesis
MSKFEVYCINLDHRTDRKILIESLFENNPYFNLNFSKAISHDSGKTGCKLSHLQLLKFAKNQKLPFIIVIEDDIILNCKLDTLNKIINNLVLNLEKWEIFNGSPTFTKLLKYGKQRKDEIYVKDSGISDLVHINWGQTTSFMIYNSNVYDKLIDKIELYLKYDIELIIQEVPLDVIISMYFIQTAYKYKYITYQYNSQSDIIHKDILNNILFESQEKIFQNLKEAKSNLSLRKSKFFLNSIEKLIK